MSAPDRIWAWPFVAGKQDDVIKGGWDDAPDRKLTEYIRADLVPAKEGYHQQEYGMSMRDYFAGQAIGQIIQTCLRHTRIDGESAPEAFARKAYEIADAMLAARKSGDP